MTAWMWKQTKGIKYIYLPDWLAQGVMTAFTARIGGESGGEYDSLNLALHVGDDPFKVIANRTKVLDACAGRMDGLVCCQQVHGNRGAVVDLSYSGRGALQYEDGLPDTDALVTDTPGIILGTYYADCIPVYVFDPDNLCVALIHSGWKGTISHITAKTMILLQKQYGSNLRHISVFIGPGIDRCCFEIQSDLEKKVRQEFISHDTIIGRKDGKIFWDLKSTIRQELLLLGVPTKNILTCELCTCCRGDLFYSYRREKSDTGRMGAFISIKPDKL